MIKFIFCYNQISYTLAKKFDEKYRTLNIIIYDGNRIKVYGKSFKEFKYTKFIAFIVFLCSFFSAFCEVVIPHTNGGNVLSLISKFCRNLSYIDDGMDTFREKPKNIDVAALTLNSRYYTFDYSTATATWLMSLNKIPLTKINSLIHDSRELLDLSKYGRVVVDSPGVNIDFFASDNTFIVLHPNKSKSSVYNKFSIKGNTIPLEKSLINYDGEIVVGESMVFIFLLNCLIDLSKVTLCLNIKDYENVKCLHADLSRVGKLVIV